MTVEIERVSTEPRWFSLNLSRVHVSNASSEGGFSLIEMSGRRYDSPLHVHHHESETHYVLEGVLRIHIPGRSVELSRSVPAERDEIPLGPHRGAKAVPPADALRTHGLETLGPPGTMPDPPASDQSR